MITDSQGRVAIRYHQNLQKYVMLGNKHEYVFTVSRVISLAFVDPADVGAILNIKHSCNCPNGKSTPAFRYATQQEVNIWTGQGDFHAPN